MPRRRGKGQVPANKRARVENHVEPSEPGTFSRNSAPLSESVAFLSNSAALTQADIPAIVQQVLSSLSATSPTPSNGMGYPTCSISGLLSSSPPASSEVTNVQAISVSSGTTGYAGSAASYCLRSLVHPSVTWVTPLCTTTSSVPRTSTNPTADNTT